MTLPGDLTSTTVTGRFVDAAGVPLAGSVTFTPSADLTDDTGSVNVPAVTRRYVLTRGSFQTDPLISTDNDTISPSGWTYEVCISITGLPPLTYSILLPSSPSTVDLSAVTPVVPQGAVTSFLQLTGGDVTGPLVLSGGLQIPAGAENDYVLTSTRTATRPGRKPRAAAPGASRPSPWPPPTGSRAPSPAPRPPRR